MTDRWAHQRACFDEHDHLPAFALEWDPRTGKSRGLLDHVLWWYHATKIDGLMIVAFPKDVHHNWVRIEIPTWMDPSIPWMAVPWRPEKAQTRAYEAEFEKLLRFKGLAIFALNADAISDRKEKGGGPKKTARVKIFMHRFIEARKIFLAVDEVDWAEDPRSARSQCIQKVAYRPNVVAKRILGATIGADSPFGYYVPYSLLAPPEVIFGLPDYFSFTHRYGAYKTSDAVPQYEMRYDKALRRTVPVIGANGKPVVKRDASGRPITKPGVEKGFNFKTKSLYELRDTDPQGNPRYRNLDELKARLDPWRMVVKRRDVSDAPPKIYQRLFYEMSAEQRRVYDALRDEHVVRLSDLSEVTADHVLTVLLRLQQVLGNHLPGHEQGVVCDGCDGEGCVACDDVGIVLKIVPTRVVDPNRDPRLEALVDLFRREPMPTIVWARFTSEVDAICEVLRGLGRRVVRFDGKVGSQERLDGKDAFQRGEMDDVVGNQATGGRGLRMDRAEREVFYSNLFSRKTREQAEDRAEAIGRKLSTVIVDVCCEGTVDERIAGALLAKKSVKEAVTGDGWREWLK